MATWIYTGEHMESIENYCYDMSSIGLLWCQQASHSQYRCIKLWTWGRFTQEHDYAQIEKDSWHLCGRAKIQCYSVWLSHFKILTDHKPLVPLVNSRDVPDTPVRCQRLLICLMQCDNTICERMWHGYSCCIIRNATGITDIYARQRSHCSHECNEILSATYNRKLDDIRHHTYEDPGLQ